MIERARAGDALAERALYDAHVDRVFRLAYRMTGDEELAKDFTQDAFVRAFTRLDGFRGEAAFSTWLHSIAVSVVLNGLRGIKRRRQREVELHPELPVAREERLPEPNLRKRMHAAIDSLSERCRTVFLMHDLEGYTHEEIGGALDIATGTSKATLFRARTKLRELLADVAGEYAQ